MSAKTAAKPLIRFEIPNSDIVVKCSQGHDTFRLELRVRLAGAMVTRHAVCVTCGETERLDEK